MFTLESGDLSSMPLLRHTLSHADISDPLDTFEVDSSSLKGPAVCPCSGAQGHHAHLNLNSNLDDCCSELDDVSSQDTFRIADDTESDNAE